MLNQYRKAPWSERRALQWVECGKTNNFPWLSTLVLLNKFADNIRQVTNLLLNFWNTLLEIWSLSLSHRYPIHYGTSWGNFAQLSYWYCSRITHRVSNSIFKNFDRLFNSKVEKPGFLFIYFLGISYHYQHICIGDVRFVPKLISSVAIFGFT